MTGGAWKRDYREKVVIETISDKANTRVIIWRLSANLEQTYSKLQRKEAAKKAFYWYFPEF